MLCLIPFLLLGITNVLTSSLYSKLELKEDKQYNLDEAEDIFLEFIQKHDRKYETYEEYEHRFHIFVKNLENINQWNESPTATYKVNKFSDMTDEEFSERYTGLFLDESVSERIVKYVPKGKAPETLDWRQKNLVTEVKDQGSCGSCFAFSAIGCIEGQHAKKHNKLISLSEQQGLDCEQRGSCSGGGDPINVMNALAAQGGSMKGADYPYTQMKGQCKTDTRRIAVKVKGGQHLEVRDEEGLKSALAEYGPLSIALSVYSQFKSYNSGIARPGDCNATLTHALTLVGYGTENGSGYWIIKNSWGNWGEQGYIRLDRKMTQCGITRYVSLALVD